MLDELDFGQTEPIVRINSVTSGLAQTDLDVIFQADRVPPTFMVPKVDQMEQINWVMFVMSLIQLILLLFYNVHY